MAFALQASEHPVVGLKRVAREQLGDALAQLDRLGQEDPGEAVHEIRKATKKTRAVLRLLRGELGKRTYRSENKRLRNIARSIGHVRDADVVAATLESLSAQPPERLRTVLENRRQEARAELREEGALREQLEAELLETRARIDAWPLDHADSRLFRKNLKALYRQGRKRFRKVRKEPTSEGFHELRKRVKDLWYCARILEKAGGQELRSFQGWADEVADLLGLDHDLSVLAELVEEIGSGGADAEEREAIALAIDQRRLELQVQALPLLERLFAERPKSFSRRWGQRFDAWRQEQVALPLVRLTPENAERAAELLRRKESAGGTEAARLRTRLRELGIEAGPLAALSRDRSELRADDLGELVERGIVAVGTGSGTPPVDELADVDVEIGPNEASGLCPIESDAVLERCGWSQGFWVILDESDVSEGTVAVGHAMREARWEARELPTRRADAGPTEDGEDCVRIDGWIYVFGSHYGSKAGPLDPERQFVARFRESDAFGSEPVELEVERTGFRLHRLVNDALAEHGPPLWELADEAREALVVATKAEGSEGIADLVRETDQPINVEGVAVRSNGAILLGLRYPVSADGHPLMVELAGVDRLFEGELPEVKGVWTLEGIGSRFVPAGIRGLGEGEDGAIEALTGNLDSTGKGSVLVKAHPAAGLARSAHLRLRLPGNRRGGVAAGELVREFPGERRVEGVAVDELRRTFYVIDEEQHVDLRYCEAFGRDES